MELTLLGYTMGSSWELRHHRFESRRHGICPISAAHTGPYHLHLDRARFGLLNRKPQFVSKYFGITTELSCNVPSEAPLPVRSKAVETATSSSATHSTGPQLSAGAIP